MCAWLIINSMRSENVQFGLLCQQNLENMWRKVALNSLMQHHQSFFGTVTPENQQFFTMHLADCLDALRHRLDYSVPAALPRTVKYSCKLQTLIRRHSHLLETTQERTQVRGCGGRRRSARESRISRDFGFVVVEEHWSGG